MSCLTSRRALLAGLATSTVLTVPALAGEAHPDAELLALGRELDAANAVWFAFRPKFEAADDGRAQAFQERSGELKEARDRGERARDEIALEIGAPFEPAIQRGNALADVSDAVCDRIVRLRPTTPEGYAVILRALATWFISLWDSEPQDLEWDGVLIRAAVDNGLTLAGIDRLGRPRVAA